MIQNHDDMTHDVEKLVNLINCVPNITHEQCRVKVNCCLVAFFLTEQAVFRYNVKYFFWLVLTAEVILQSVSFGHKQSMDKLSE